MFIITEQHLIPSHYQFVKLGPRRGGKGCHGTYQRHHNRYHPYPDSAETGCGRRASSRHCVQSKKQDAETTEAEPWESDASKVTTPTENAIADQQHPNDGKSPSVESPSDDATKQVKESPSDSSKPAPAANQTARLQRHNTNAEDNMIVERTPAHREETDEAATIALDVSGFTADQLNISLELENIADRAKGRGAGQPILTISGQRVNNLGDKYVIRRRFMLERDNLAEDINTIPIQASMSPDGILTVKVPKKKKEETVEKPVSRSIPITTVQATTQDTVANAPSIASEQPAAQEPEVITVTENEHNDGDKKPAAAK